MGKLLDHVRDPSLKWSMLVVTFNSRLGSKYYV